MGSASVSTAFMLEQQVQRNTIRGFVGVGPAPAGATKYISSHDTASLPQGVITSWVCVTSATRLPAASETSV